MPSPPTPLPKGEGSHTRRLPLPKGEGSDPRQSTFAVFRVVTTMLSR